MNKKITADIWRKVSQKSSNVWGTERRRRAGERRATLQARSEKMPVFGKMTSGQTECIRGGREALGQNTKSSAAVNLKERQGSRWGGRRERGRRRGREGETVSCSALQVTGCPSDFMLSIIRSFWGRFKQRSNTISFLFKKVTPVAIRRVATGHHPSGEQCPPGPQGRRCGWGEMAGFCAGFEGRVEKTY